MIEGLKPYPKYKDSGVEWLGQVPESWEVKRLKDVAVVQTGLTLGKIYQGVETQAYPYLRVANVQHERLDLREIKYVDVPAGEAKGCTLRPGDVLMTEGGDIDKLGRGCVWRGEVLNCLHQNHVFAVRCKPTALMSEFLVALMSSPHGRAYFELTAKQTTNLASTNSTTLRAFPLLLPPQNEQAAIVRLLEHVDRRMRRYIRAKQRLIALLNEQKQAIIHQAVTRGLNPNACLKSSGVNALGAVPEHWHVVPFKRRVGFQEGPGIMAVDFRDSGIPLLRISCLRDDEANLNGCNFLDPEMVRGRWSHFSVRAGDYLLSASGSTGKVTLATTTVSGAIPYTGILRLWALTDQTCMPFVKMFMECRPFQDQINAAKSGVAIEHFGPTHLKRMFIALPPLEEQQAIVRWVEENTASFSGAIAVAQREIALLCEYRTRLIADVVTGKLDVRAAAAALPDEPEEPDDTEPLEDEEQETEEPEEA